MNKWKRGAPIPSHGLPKHYGSTVVTRYIKPINHTGQACHEDTLNSLAGSNANPPSPLNVGWCEVGVASCRALLSLREGVGYGNHASIDEGWGMGSVAFMISSVFRHE